MRTPWPSALRPIASACCALVACAAGCSGEVPADSEFAAPTDTAAAADAGAQDVPTGSDVGAVDAPPTDTTLSDTAPQDASGADAQSQDVAKIDALKVDAIGSPCKTAADCGPAPSLCTNWQCTGVCYPLLANSTPCEDGDPCTVNDVCFVGKCQSGKAKVCDDSNPCTTDTCNGAGACAHSNVADGVGCGGGKSCTAGACGGGVGAGIKLAVAADDTTCALLKTGGKVFCWGNDKQYQAGSAASQGKWYTKPEPVAGLPAATDLDCGGGHCCAVTSSGLYCWGDDQFGQSSGKGDGQKPSALIKVPTQVAVPATGVAVGEFHSCAIDQGGIVRCWGLGSSGQLGHGKSEVGSPPVVVLLTKPASALVCGARFCCALVDGVPSCWGQNNAGQLGIATNAEKNVPTPASGVTGVLKLAIGEDHCLALVAGGKVMSWGANESHQVGRKGTSSMLSPGLIDGLSGVSALAAGGHHSCAVIGDQLHCWGGNGKKQAAPTSKSLIVDAPTLMPGLTDVGGVALGASHSCYWHKSSGALYCWGANNLGQVGNGTDKDVGLPFAVQ